MEDGDAYAGCMSDRMQWDRGQKQGRIRRSGVTSKRMKRMQDDVHALRQFQNRGISPGVFLEHVVVSSADLTALKSKSFRNFSVISASCSLFLRVFVGCSGMNRRKEKPPETCLFPVV